MTDSESKDGMISFEESIGSSSFGSGPGQPPVSPVKTVVNDSVLGVNDDMAVTDDEEEDPAIAEQLKAAEERIQALNAQIAREQDLRASMELSQSQSQQSMQSSQSIEMDGRASALHKQVFQNGPGIIKKRQFQTDPQMSPNR